MTSSSRSRELAVRPPPRELLRPDEPEDREPPAPRLLLLRELLLRLPLDDFRLPPDDLRLLADDLRELPDDLRDPPRELLDLREPLERELDLRPPLDLRDPLLLRLPPLDLRDPPAPELDLRLPPPLLRDPRPPPPPRLLSPASDRSLFTVRAAISSARSLLMPRDRPDSLMCSY
jgi:hypothetical protein